MNKPVKRFRVFNTEYQTRVFEADTTNEVADFFSKQDVTTLEEFFVDCVIDDIEVTANDFMEVWNEGERPGDLQFF